MASITLYVGPSGSGRTVALQRHRSDLPRRLTLDVLQLSHRAMLVAVLDGCGVAVPKRADIPTLAALAVAALAEQPTLLLLDNVDRASAQQVPTIGRLLDAATEAALSAEPPTRTIDRIAALRRRARLVELRPLDDEAALRLIRERAPRLDNASRAEIVRQAQGHPQTLTAYAERVAAHGSGERHALTPPTPPRRWPQIVVLIAVLVAVHWIRRSVGATLAADVLLSAVIIFGFMIRTRIRQAMK
jgi:hypothetical protein